MAAMLIQIEPEPFRYAGRAYKSEAIRALCRLYGPCRVRNACADLDIPPRDEYLRDIARWCREDDNIKW